MRYSFEFPAYGVQFAVDRLRRDHQELVGELSVMCGLAGAKTVNGSLSVADFNFSSARARSERAKLLGERAMTNGKIDWMIMLEEFCQRVFAAEREGSPAVLLKTIERPAPNDDFTFDGFTVPRRHPSILFGDGGTGKSYIALWLAGQLVAHQYRVAIFDWELAAEDHRDRLERLFPVMPDVLYCRCELPLVHEVDRLRKVVEEHKIDYAIYDSIAFACNGRPEDAEIAGQYFRAVRSIGVGSLHIAHINKSDDSDKKPFGSSFWFNGARMIWFAQASERVEESEPLRVGLFNRKSNLGRLRPVVGMQLTFTGSRTRMDRFNVGESQDLAGKLSIRQRMYALLKDGSMTLGEIAEELDEKIETVKRIAYRSRAAFVVLEGGRVGRKAVGV